MEKQITTAKRNPDFNPLVGPRERQICELLLQGGDNQDIAKELGMARRTVKAVSTVSNPRRHQTSEAGGFALPG